MDGHVNTLLWAQTGPSVLAAFLACTVEGVEALTVLLAVGSVRGWRSTLLGTAAGLACLLVGGVACGPGVEHLPVAVLRLIVGTLLVLFGLRWLQKAILRSAGVMSAHDETAAYARQVERYRGGRPALGLWDGVAFGAAFQIVLLEGLEVVFVVIAIVSGDARLSFPVGAAALVALLLVTATGFLLRRPLSRVPENALKFTVGVVLSAFGTYWSGEGMGVVWPAAEWSIVALIGAYLVVAIATVRLCRASIDRARLPSPGLVSTR